MPNQFIHYETYGLCARNGGPTISGVLAEAERVPSHSKHVAQPKQPKLLFGENPSTLLTELQQAAARAKDRTGKRKLPKDAKLLLAGVVSMPMRTEDLISAHATYVNHESSGRPPALKTYQKWLRLTTSFLRQQYGDALRSIVMHYDEEHVHIHYYAMNTVTNGTLNLDGLDPAADAERKLGLGRAQRNKSGAERKKVRTTALRAFQDSYFSAVGNAMGWERAGPKKPRMNRKEYTRDKARQEKLAAAKHANDTLLTRLASTEGELGEIRELYKEAINQVTPELEHLRRAVRALALQPAPANILDVERRLNALSDRSKLKK